MYPCEEHILRSFTFSTVIRTQVGTKYRQTENERKNMPTTTHCCRLRQNRPETQKRKTENTRRPPALDAAVSEDTLLQG